MPYRLIIRHHSGTASFHDATSEDTRCLPRSEAGYTTIVLQSPSEAAVVVYREGLKLVSCPACQAPLPSS